MLLRKVLVIAVFVLAASGCGSLQTGIGDIGAPDVQRSYALSDITFSAAPDLTVSESETFYPFADVIWRGDPKGARVPQIGAMFEVAAQRSKTELTGERRVIADIELLRFHGVTDRTRYSTGGVYNVLFALTVRDAATGTVIEPERRVVANLRAPGGAQAVFLEQNGQPQKVRVTNFLATVLRDELS